jgi:hypothetical protein
MVIEPEAIHTVALFAHARGDVVTAAPVRRALARIGADALSLAAGADFKREAEALLTARRVSIVRFGEAGWTDTSVVALRP